MFIADNPKAQQVLTNDGLISPPIGIGTGIDRTLNKYRQRKALATFVDIEMYELLHEQNSVATNIIEQFPESMGKNLPVFEYPDENIRDTIQSIINQLVPLFVSATKKARLLGGSAILLDFAGDISRPARGLPSNFSVLECRVGSSKNKIFVDDKDIDRDPYSERFEKPFYYSIRGSSKLKIHHSRILQFDGTKTVTFNQQKYYRHWGIPVLQKSCDLIATLDVLDYCVQSTIDKFNRLVIEIDNYWNLIDTTPGKQKLDKRASDAAYRWNLSRMLFVQTGEKVYNLGVEFSELAEIIPYVMQRIAASCDTPFSKIFNVGHSAGMGSSNSSASTSADRTDERDWAILVATKWATDWLPLFDHVIKICLAALTKKPEPYKLVLPSLIETSAPELLEMDRSKADTLKVTAETFKILLEMDVVSLEDIKNKLAELNA